MVSTLSMFLFVCLFVFCLFLIKNVTFFDLSEIAEKYHACISNPMFTALSTMAQGHSRARLLTCFNSITQVLPPDTDLIGVD